MHRMFAAATLQRCAVHPACTAQSEHVKAFCIAHCRIALPALQGLGAPEGNGHPLDFSARGAPTEILDDV